MSFFRLEKPVFQKEDSLAVVEALNKSGAELRTFVRAVNQPDYLFWDSVKHKKPLPPNITAGQAWFAVKLLRSLERQESPIRTTSGDSFGWTKLTTFERYYHEFDLHTGGELGADEKKRLISKGLMDEAIASAQLEGADTSRSYAKKCCDKILSHAINPIR